MVDLDILIFMSSRLKNRVTLTYFSVQVSIKDHHGPLVLVFRGSKSDISCELADYSHEI